MLKKTKVTAIALLVSVLLLATPLMLVQGQTLTSPAAKVVWLAEKIFQPQKKAVALLCAIAAISSIWTYQRNLLWQDNIAFLDFFK